MRTTSQTTVLVCSVIAAGCIAGGIGYRAHSHNPSTGETKLQRPNGIMARSPVSQAKGSSPRFVRWVGNGARAKGADLPRGLSALCPVILIGHVTSISGPKAEANSSGETMIFTDYGLAVDKVVRTPSDSPAEPNVTLRTVGGVVDGLGMLNDRPEFVVGEQVLVFLDRLNRDTIKTENVGPPHYEASLIGTFHINGAGECTQNLQQGPRTYPLAQLLQDINNTPFDREWFRNQDW